MSQQWWGKLLFCIVSWIRKRDLHILTAGILTYTSDQRFQVIRPDKSENWTLQVKFPQERDAGIYECQVNTEPKMSLAFQLNVVEAKAKVLGPADLYVKTGSSLALTCVLSQGPHDLGTIFWYKGSKLIEYKEVEENEIVEEQRLRLKTEWTEQLTSRLTIQRVVPTDSGNYSCVNIQLRCNMETPIQRHLVRCQSISLYRYTAP
ncbi:unnamed protein product [Leptidea sinapis]|uniref:Ig-like domain-containing protein n=1 Tax=Leptidea sinapis TaxID=189913 RepID=A0A5E4QQJ5_9NEOP|nr:unnamed protein product [Leptidea sinapis]